MCNPTQRQLALEANLHFSHSPREPDTIRLVPPPQYASRAVDHVAHSAQRLQLPFG